MQTKGSDETNSEQINFLNNLPLKALALTKCKKNHKKKNPPPKAIQPTFAYVPARVLDGWVAVDIGK